ncbi:DUF4372 domain-containing protein [Cyclobacterium lianum]
MVSDHLSNTVVEETKWDRYCKKIDSKEHFISLFYSFLTRNCSFREF